jgi:hypothetical protein
MKRAKPEKIKEMMQVNISIISNDLNISRRLRPFRSFYPLLFLLHAVVA